MPSIKLGKGLKDGSHPVYSLLDSLVSTSTTSSSTTTSPPLNHDAYNSYDEEEEGEPWINGPFQPSTDRYHHHHLFASPATPGKHNPMMSMAVLMLIVVASLSLVVGAIYMLIYFKSIKPMSARSRSYVDQGGKTDDDGGRSKSAHPFFRRK